MYTYKTAISVVAHHCRLKYDIFLFLHRIFVQRLIILALTDQATTAAYLRLEILIMQPLIDIYNF